MNLCARAKAELVRRGRLAANSVIVLSIDSQGWLYRGDRIDADQADRLRANAGTVIVIRREPAALPIPAS